MQHSMRVRKTASTQPSTLPPTYLSQTATTPTHNTTPLPCVGISPIPLTLTSFMALDTLSCEDVWFIACNKNPYNNNKTAVRIS